MGRYDARMILPTLEYETDLLGVHQNVVGMDEVGRGCLAGPVYVGAVMISDASTAPPGIRDSKLLTAKRRVELVPQIQAWAAQWSIGAATAGEIDAMGIVAALSLAGTRALQQIQQIQQPEQIQPPACVILDGAQNWLPKGPYAVETKVGGDLSCVSVAAASIIAKVARDVHMAELHQQYPNYAWNQNKGYGTKAHREAIAAHGPVEQHRKSWRLLPKALVDAE